jgi:hypothetical protein
MASELFRLLGGEFAPDPRLKVISLLVKPMQLISAIVRSI